MVRMVRRRRPSSGHHNHHPLLAVITMAGLVALLGPRSFSRVGGGIFVHAAGFVPNSSRSTRSSLAATSISFRKYDRSSNTMRRFSSSNDNDDNNNKEEYGIGMDQDDMMESDLLIAVDANDIVIEDAHLTKRNGHAFSKDTPRGILHRAFSFFLFNQDNKMLLTQRASTKITFPNVWTNTCCSHPLQNMQLHGQHKDEVDITPGAYPSFPGIKHAACRKLKHELGIDPCYIPHSQIQFITRFHYWAADTITYNEDGEAGSGCPWGEHEVDYILFMQTNEDIPVHANPDEVSDYKYVSIAELQTMMNEEKGEDGQPLLWSPWFCGIMDRGGWDYWNDLDGSLNGKYTNDQIQYFDPPTEHYASYNLPNHDRYSTGVLKQPLSR